MSDLESTIVFEDLSISEVLKKIERSEAKIACVVDKNKKLLGVVTDGDVRRGLINGVELSAKVTSIMQDQPVTATPDTPVSTLRDMLDGDDVLYIPIVDNGILVGLTGANDLKECKNKSHPVLIMAGGFGTRLGDLTNTCPKPLLRIGDKPILETIIDRFKKDGFNRFYISVHYKAEMIMDYFGNGEKFGVEIQYLKEETPLGTAGPLAYLKKEESTILMINGDVLTKVDFDSFLNFHRENKSDFTMCAREYGFQVPYGVINSTKYKVQEIVEKPVKKFLVNAGVYAIEPAMLNRIDEGQSMDMNIFIDGLISNKKEVCVYPLYEYWQDVGQREHFDQAQVDYDKIFNM